MNILCFCLFLSGIVVGSLANQQLCKPYGVRLALGQTFKNPESPELLTVRFNTKVECEESYLIYNFTTFQIFKEGCTQTLLTFSEYASYVHTCVFSKIPIGVQIDYMVFGKGFGTTAIPFEKSLIPTHVVGAQENIQIVCIADWGYLRRKPWDPLEEAFDTLLNSDIDIDALYIGGDIAYNLGSQDGRNYEDFIMMLSQVSCRWPTIFTTGNHERMFSKKNTYIFNTSFENYGNIDTNVTTLHFHTFNFLIYDPYQVVYGRKPDDQLLADFNAEIQRIQQDGKPIVVGAHYPGQCSAQERCERQTELLLNFWQSMIDHKIVLYLAGHSHTYERLYPYYSMDNYLIQESPYTFTKDSKYLIQVIEGVAGNDESLIQEYKNVQNYTAAYSENQTGFGILNISKANYTFQHFKSDDPFTPFDTLITRWSPSMFRHSNLRIQEE